ncbi:hypothetical protein [Streptomyces crystallinus]|uniref:hypothetical protein n=1 Tax=Streptomyces crystallinus TaxID=68191 RepID=UPI0031D48B17
MTSIFVVFAAVSILVLLIPSVRRARLRRWARDHFDPARYGLVARDQLDASRPGPPPPLDLRKETQAVADAAWDGDWHAAAAFVDAAGTDWDLRWSRLEVLQEIALHQDAWLGKWRTAQPGNGDAATVYASVLLHRAWQVRGTAYARKVPVGNMTHFKALLPGVMEAAQHAARLAPQDPAPWVVMVTAARALTYTHEEFHGLWENLTARAPYHYAGHWQALQYWCEKWHGSHKLMRDFALRAVRSAPAGSPLAGIYLHSLVEYEKAAVGFEKASGSPGVSANRAVRKILIQVAHCLDQVPETNAELPRLRHLLAYYLGQGGQFDAALEQFRLIGPWCGAAPWTTASDPVAAFDLARATAARKSTPTST